jgi:hypothetical protein
MGTSNSSYQDDMDYLLDYAREDWVGMSPVSAVVGAAAGKGATFDELMSTMLAVVGELLECGAVPGDLVDQDQSFKPWPGAKEEHLRRIEAEITALGRLPESGEVAWIHDPSA